MRTYCTHPDFETTQNWHRLKPGKSASKVLEDLMTKYEMISDCGKALMLVYHLAILEAMKEVHGKETGEKRFDTFFGSSTENNPEERRLLLSMFGPIIGTQHMPSHPQSKQPFPFQPLAFLMYDTKNYSNVQEMLTHIQLGDMIMYLGCHEYNQYHPTGTQGGFVCAVSSTKPLKLRTFGHASSDKTEADLLALHKEGYESEPTDASKALVSPFLRAKPLFDARKVVGFAKFFITFRTEAANQLLYAPIPEILQAFNAYYLTEKMQILSLSADNQQYYADVAYSEIKAKSKPKPKPETKEASVGFGGLKPGFLNPAKKK